MLWMSLSWAVLKCIFFFRNPADSNLQNCYFFVSLPTVTLYCDQGRSFFPQTDHIIHKTISHLRACAKPPSWPKCFCQLIVKNSIVKPDFFVYWFEFTANKRIFNDGPTPYWGSSRSSLIWHSQERPAGQLLNVLEWVLWFSVRACLSACVINSVRMPPGLEMAPRCHFVCL